MKNPNIEIHYNSDTKEILGDGKNVTGILVSNNKTGEVKTIDVSGFFCSNWP